MSEENELKYKISVSGETNGAAKVEEALKKVREAAEKLGGEGLEKFISKAAEFATVAGALELAKEGLEEFAKAEETLVAQNAALKQRSQDTAEYRERLAGLAETMQGLTAIDNDRWVKALTTGIQAGANPEQIEKFAEMTKNAAGLPKLLGNIEAASESVGKAIGGNFTEFTRLGFIISDNATQAQKLDELFQQLSTRGGGQLEERAKTLHGQFKTLSNAAADFFKTLGKGVSDTGIVQSTTYGLSKTFDLVTGAIKGLIVEAPELKSEIKEVGEEMWTAEKRAENLRQKLEEIRKGPEDAAKKREEFATKLSKENQEKVDTATDAAGLETARVNALESMGLIKPEEAEKRRRGIASGLEHKKQEIALSEISGQIANRKVGLDESRVNAVTAAQKVKEEEEKLAKFQKLADEEEKIRRHFDNKIEPIKEDEKKRLRRNRAGFYPDQELDFDAEQAPEIAPLIKQKEEALFAFRKKNGPHDIARQQEKIEEAKAKASEADTADWINSQNIAAEIGGLEKQRDQLTSKYRVQNSTRAIGDFQAVYGAGKQNQSATSTGGMADIGSIKSTFNQALAATANKKDEQIELLQIMQAHARALISDQAKGNRHDQELAELRSVTSLLSKQIQNSPGRG